MCTLMAITLWQIFLGVRQAVAECEARSGNKIRGVPNSDQVLAARGAMRGIDALQSVAAVLVDGESFPFEEGHDIRRKVAIALEMRLPGLEIDHGGPVQGARCALQNEQFISFNVDLEQGDTRLVRDDFIERTKIDFNAFRARCDAVLIVGPPVGEGSLALPVADRQIVRLYVCGFVKAQVSHQVPED